MKSLNWSKYAPIKIKYFYFWTINICHKTYENFSLLNKKWCLLRKQMWKYYFEIGGWVFKH
jgi:hypothetical protein